MFFHWLSLQSIQQQQQQNIRLSIKSKINSTAKRSRKKKKPTQKFASSHNRRIENASNAYPSIAVGCLDDFVWDVFHIFFCCRIIEFTAYYRVVKRWQLSRVFFFFFLEISKNSGVGKHSDSMPPQTIATTIVCTDETFGGVQRVLRVCDSL
jgi:hypothetical protein